MVLNTTTTYAYLSLLHGMIEVGKRVDKGALDSLA